MFRILVRDLNLFGYHGVKEREKKDGQNFRFNIEILINKGSFLNDDDIDSTVNYSEAIKLIKRINNSEKFNLLETLSEIIAGKIMDMSPLVDKVIVRIEKTSPPVKEDLKSVGVEYVLDRKREERNKFEKGKVDVYLSLGSNVGNRENNLRKAVDLISSNPNINVVKVSSIYETEPMYLKDQNSFYNVVLQAHTGIELGPFEMMGFLKGIEFGFGRKKDIKYGPRIIDVDLLYYGEIVIESDFLTVPHPGIEERKFVLVPLSEIAPELKIKSRNIGKFIADCNLTEKVKLIKNW